MKKGIKILAAVMALSLVTAVAACGTDETTETTAEDTTAAADEESTEDTTADEDADYGTKDDGIIVMGTNAAFPPFEYIEGDAVIGVDVEIMQAIADSIGYELQVEDMEFDSLATALSNGQIDCIAAGYTVSPDREETMDFSDSYYTASQTVIVAADSDIETVDDLADKVIGVQTGTSGSWCAEDATAEENIKGFGNGMLAVEALMNGQVDAVIIDNNPANEYYDENPDDLKLLEGLFDDEAYAIAVAKDNSALLEVINEGLAQIKEDGTYDEIIAKYIK